MEDKPKLYIQGLYEDISKPVNYEHIPSTVCELVERVNFLTKLLNEHLCKD